MLLNIKLTSLKADPNRFGEALLNEISYTGFRWGYNTRKFSIPAIEKELDETDTDVMNNYFGSEELIDMKDVYKAELPSLDLIVYLHWDGDGTMVFKHIKEKWCLYTFDCKSDYNWEWAK